jgi:uncharacterized protein YjbJ (UPF0337 family)
MKWDQIESQWKEFAVSAQAHWSKLTDDDCHGIIGTREHLAGRIQHRYGITIEEAEGQVDEWSDGLLDIAETSRVN